MSNNMWECAVCSKEIAPHSNHCVHCGAQFNSVQKSGMHASKMATKGGCVIWLPVIIAPFAASAYFVVDALL